MLHSSERVNLLQPDEHLGGNFAAVDAHRRAAALLQHSAALHLHAVPSQPLPIWQLHIIDSAWSLQYLTVLVSGEYFVRCRNIANPI